MEKEIYIFLLDRKFIEQPLKPAPPPIVTVHKAGGYSGYSSTTTQGYNYSSSSAKNTSSSFSYKVSLKKESIIAFVKKKGKKDKYLMYIIFLGYRL